MTPEQSLAPAIQLHQSGRLPEAEAAYQQVLARQPDNADALHLLGVAVGQTGRVELAVELIARAIVLRPGDADFHANLGEFQRRRGDLEGAAVSLRGAVRLGADSAGVQANLGWVLKEIGRLQESIEAFRLATALDPTNMGTRIQLGSVLLQDRQGDEALNIFTEIAASHPDSADANYYLGLAFKDKGLLDEAMAELRRAVELNPGFAEAHCAIGLILRARGSLDEAIAACGRAIALKPDLADAHANLGAALGEKREYQRAIVANARAIELDPGHAQAHWHLALNCLILGDYDCGWREYEWRFKTVVPAKSFPRPQWDGGDLNGKTILVHFEQGLGDTIQFIRYAPLVAGRGGKVIVACQPPLVRLLEGLSGVDRVVSANGALPDFDVCIHLLSLPGLFRTRLETIPGDVPYLSADPAFVERWRKRLSGEKRFKVGLAWAGNPRHWNDRGRSVPPRALVPLAGVGGVSFYSLQKGKAMPMERALPLVDFTDELADFADTAALVANLDLVITADSAVGHLAGALGKAVWVLLPTASDWRWLTDREDTPWYPRMRLFRQSVEGDWGEVVHGVLVALGEFSGGG